VKRSEEVFERVMEGARTDRQRSMRNIKRACDYLEEKKLEIRPVAVAKHIKTQYGSSPGSVQSIRNDPDGYLAYVRMRAMEQKLPRNGGVPGNGRGDLKESTLMSMEKHELISLCNVQEAAILSLKNQCQLMKREVTKLSIDPNSLLEHPLQCSAPDEDTGEEFERTGILLQKQIEIGTLRITKSGLFFHSRLETSDHVDHYDTEKLTEEISKLCGLRVDDLIEMSKEVRETMEEL
jgi:hypothetical protein